MSYIGDMRKFVGYAPITAATAMASLYKKLQQGCKNNASLNL